MAAPLLLSALLLLATAAALRCGAPALGLLSACALLVHSRRPGGLRTVLRLLFPVVLFAAIFLVLAAWAGPPDWLLPARTITVFLLTTASVRVLPWAKLADRVRPGSHWYVPALFLLFVRHFTSILISETRRALEARSLSIPRRLGPGWFSSLVWAVAGLFRRVYIRAERFYAAQLTSGLAE